MLDWLNMTELTQGTIFFGLFAAGLVFTLLTFVLQGLFDGIEDIFGGIFSFLDFDFDLGDVDGSTPGLFRAFTVFVTSFGGVGWVATVNGAGPIAASAYGLLGGLVMGALTIFSLLLIYRQQASSMLRSGSLVGTEGTLTIGIPEQGTGKAALNLAGSLVTRSARSQDGRAIPHNSRIKVIAEEGSSVIVTEIKGD